MNTPLKTIKINFFGELWTLKKVLLNPIEQEYFETIASRLKLPLYKALLDPFFYFHLKLNYISSIDKLPCEKISGILNNSKSHIEIWIDRKKIEKLQFTNLVTSQHLFPLFTTQKLIVNFSSTSGIYIEQKEIGYIGSYEFKIEDFSIEKLNFILIESNNELLLEKITYPNSKMVFKTKETLINYQNSYEIPEMELQ